jgi:hypothetical protein
MQSIVDSFSNRELAILFWLAALVIWALLRASVRSSLVSLLKMIFWSKLTTYFLAVAAYTIGVAYLLWRVDLWDIGQLKNTALWFFTVGAVSLFDITNQKKSNYFRAAIIDVLSFTAILQFIVSVYSFHFLIELLLIPSVVLIGGTMIVAQHDSKHQAVAKLLSNLVALAGLFLIGYTLYKIVSDFRGFANSDTLNDFLIPALLSFLFLPLLYILSIIVTHDDVFTGIGRAIKNSKVRKYARWKALIHFHANKTDLNRWRKMMFLQKIKTKKDVKDSIEFIKSLKRREKNPPPVQSNKGWSPYSAKEFLTKQQIKTGFYQPTYGDEWMACSDYVKVGDDILSNNMMYYVEGNANVATKLTLTLNVHYKEHEGIAIAEFLNAVELLYKNAISQPLPELIEKAIIRGKNVETHINNSKINIEKKNWQEHKAKGYSISTRIEIV